MRFRNWLEMEKCAGFMNWDMEEKKGKWWFEDEGCEEDFGDVRCVWHDLARCSWKKKNKS